MTSVYQGGRGTKIRKTLARAIAPEILTVPAIPVDDGIKFPNLAAQWVSLGFSAPDLDWEFQEASGNLVDEVAGAIAAPVGSPGYQQTIAAFTRKAVRITSGADGYFSNAADFDPGTGAFLVYMVVEFTGSSGFSIASSFDGSTSHKIQMRNSGFIFGQLGAQTTGDVAVAHDDGNAHGIVFARDITGNELTIDTDLGSGTPATAPSTDVDATMTIGAPSSQMGNDMLVTKFTCWKTAASEAISPAAMLTALGW